jgi:CubicO group peptidase (beta-lactamase class C family)
VSRFEEVVEIARAGKEEFDVPGIALGVRFEGKDETTGLGVTSLENPLDVTPDTLFQIGSITKTYTATAIMHLAEEGKLGLDEPVRTYLPEFRLAEEDVASRATIRQLLTHTGGWLGDYFDDLGSGDDALVRMVERLADVPQLTPLGEVWSYNNSGFYLAGRVIEVVAGKPFEQALRALVLEPLGLEQSFFFADEVITRRFAVGHSLNEQQETVVARPWAIGRAAHPAGGLVCGVNELLRYARFWIEGGDLLSPESVQEMLRPQVQIGGEFDAVGLAWFLKAWDGVEVIGHGGGTKGQVTLLAIAPEQGFALVVLTNHDYGGTVGQRVLEQAMETYFGVREPELQAVELEPASIEAYLGRYESNMADVVLARTDDGLQLELEPKGGFPTPETPAPPAPPPAPFAFASKEEIFVPDGPFKGERAVFLRDDAGQIAWLRLGGRVYAPARTK